MYAVRCTDRSLAVTSLRVHLMLSFGAALHWSGLAGLALGDVTPVPGCGLRVLVRCSKTEQRGAGQEVAVWANPKETGFCPLAAIEAWLSFRQKGSDITGGASGAALLLLVGMSKAGRLTSKDLSNNAVWRLVKSAGIEGGALLGALAPGGACHQQLTKHGRNLTPHPLVGCGVSFRLELRNGWAGGGKQDPTLGDRHPSVRIGCQCQF